MKKAYNVRGLCEKAFSAFKVFSLLLVFFLGFQSQSVAQATFTNTINPGGVPKEDLKQLAQDYDFSTVSSEDVMQKLKEYGAPIMAATPSNAVAEVEQQFTVSFMRNIAKNLDNQGVSEAVTSAFLTSMSSALVARHQGEVDFDELVEDVLDAID